MISENFGKLYENLKKKEDFFETSSKCKALMAPILKSYNHAQIFTDKNLLIHEHLFVTVTENLKKVILLNHEYF